ncbi:hypothetical protein M885DRAFT_610925 [Pelagophyceae sp. CCMP2097]|nr:hypothetical protein M885DRAFT_610925 [Pelagophyceae sp. CCMP2097]|mmetsp:Transcript_26198/g.90030  ORF Transcript_26198/g.90030 Transcript_26198/m.90030 type:complete len:440 (+) Transcript_26198:90-1409(+)
MRPSSSSSARTKPPARPSKASAAARQDKMPALPDLAAVFRSWREVQAFFQNELDVKIEDRRTQREHLDLAAAFKGTLAASDMHRQRPEKQRLAAWVLSPELERKSPALARHLCRYFRCAALVAEESDAAEDGMVSLVSAVLEDWRGAPGPELPRPSAGPLVDLGAANIPQLDLARVWCYCLRHVSACSLREKRRSNFDVVHAVAAALVRRGAAGDDALTTATTLDAAPHAHVAFPGMARQTARGVLRRRRPQRARRYDASETASSKSNDDASDATSRPRAAGDRVSGRRSRASGLSVEDDDGASSCGMSGMSSKGASDYSFLAGVAESVEDIAESVEDMRVSDDDGEIGEIGGPLLSFKDLAQVLLLHNSKFAMAKVFRTWASEEHILHLRAMQHKAPLGEWLSPAKLFLHGHGAAPTPIGRYQIHDPANRTALWILSF